MYGQLKSQSWSISYDEYKNETLRLTARYSLQKIAMPVFSSLWATEKEVEDKSSSLFVKKIHEIEYEEVLPEAVGDWLVMQREFISVIGDYPCFKKITDAYKIELKKKYRIRYRAATRNEGCEINNSQNLYDEFLAENPFSFNDSSIGTPNFTYRNGLMHELMNVDNEIQWKIIKK